ncbi:MAG UNVERIFIED_CONTAM: hypothetical protein LVR18_29495 [Planctomycetaceae bacterium]|jgi:hypothetical protein
MPRVNRREIFSETDVQVFHLINRCVRRNHLCGRDRRSGAIIRIAANGFAVVWKSSLAFLR